MKILHKVLNALLVVVFLVGACIFFYPTVKEDIAAHTRADKIKNFEEDELFAASMVQDPLHEQMAAYNEQIYQEHQIGMSDAWNDGAEAFDYGDTGFEDRMVGYVSIASMDVKIPLYVGADDKTLYDGAAVLAHTSMPIGGENTNCVIAAHRGGYEGTAMFRDIEKLQVGDSVKVTNLWETLEYRVVKTIVIEPDDLDAIKIIPGKDLVTLVTCHPYGTNAQRYIVYCQRVASDTEPVVIPFDGVQYVSSAKEIAAEDVIRLGGCSIIAGVMLIVAVIWIVKMFVKK